MGAHPGFNDLEQSQRKTLMNIWADAELVMIAAAAVRDDRQRSRIDRSAGSSIVFQAEEIGNDVVWSFPEVRLWPKTHVVWAPHGTYSITIDPKERPAEVPDYPGRLRSRVRSLQNKLTRLTGVELRAEAKL